MENLIKQKRVRFSDSQKVESNKTTETSPPFQQIESFMGGNKVQNWFQTQFPRQMGEDYDPKKSELAVAVAAAAYSIYSLEEVEARYRRMMREELEMSTTKSKSMKDDTITGLPNSGRVTRGLSSRELKIGGESSAKNLVEVDRNTQENALPISRPSHSSTVRTRNPVDRDQKQQGVLPRSKSLETKADAWEKDQMEKINKRYEKMRSSILTWENERKMQARLKMGKKKGELEQRRALNRQHYQNKIARIERIAGGAIAQVEEERRDKEYEVKQKAKMIRARGKIPVKCFCC